MRVLVTGAAGYIGSHTLTHLLNTSSAGAPLQTSAPLQICAFDNFCNSSANALLRVQDVTGRDFTTVIGDIRQPSDIADAMASFRPEAVIHLAGLKAVAESCAAPLAYYATNFTGTLNILAAMDAIGCRRFVFSSSATVYGDAQYLPIDEEHPIAPASPYGRTKAMVEILLQDWCAANAEASAISLRYFNPVGAHPSGHIGEDPRGTPNNLMPYLAQVAIGKRDELAIFGNDYATRDGTGERDYIHVDDLAAAHSAALSYTMRSSGFEAVNIGTGRGHTVLELLASYERACGKPLPTVAAARRSGDIPSSYAATDRAAQLMGWKAVHDLETMCASSWRWQSRNPDGFATLPEDPARVVATSGAPITH